MIGNSLLNSRLLIAVLLALLITNLAMTTNLSSDTGPSAPEEYIRVFEPSWPGQPVQYNPERWNADIEILDFQVNRFEWTDDRGLRIDYVIKVQTNITIEIPPPTISDNTLSFGYWGYFYRFVLGVYNTTTNSFMYRVSLTKIDFDPFVMLVETDDEYSVYSSGIRVESLDPMYINYFGANVSIHWIEKYVNIETVNDLLAALEGNDRAYYRMHGIFVLVVKDLKIGISYSDAYRYVEMRDVPIKAYAGFLMWSSPGDLVGGGSGLVAWSGYGPIMAHVQTPWETTIPTTTTAPPEATEILATHGFEELFTTSSIDYELYFELNIQGVENGEAFSQYSIGSAEYHVWLKEFTSDSVRFVGDLSNMEISGSSTEMEDLARSRFEGLESDVWISLTDLSTGMQSFLENMVMMAENMGISESELSFTSGKATYKGIPAIYVKCFNTGTTYIQGEEYDYTINITAYYDRYLGFPLEVYSIMLFYGTRGEEWVRATILMYVRIVGGLELFPHELVIPTKTFSFSDGSQGTIEFIAKNGEIIDVRIVNGELAITITGDGIGSLLIEYPSDRSISSVLVDNEPVGYAYIAGKGETAYVLVSLGLSRHEVRIVFTTPLEEIVTGPMGQPGETETTTYEELVEEKSTTTTQPLISKEMLLILIIMAMIIVAIVAVILVFAMKR